MTNQLQTYLNQICPQPTWEQHTFNNSQLSKRVSAFLETVQTENTQGPESTQLHRQARYLAEDIYLDSLQPDRIGAGILHYINHYVAAHFPNDELRAALIDQICQEATTSQANNHSKKLLDLLTTESTTIPHIGNTSNVPLQTMKAVNMPTRFGDVIFLPKDAHIIVIGDTHGDLASTQRIIDNIKANRAIEQGAFIVFLGDYVHNGVKSWRNLYEILTFQQAHPDSVILLNGNHEFKESYLTALNEYLRVHWDHFVPGESSEKLPKELRDRLPQNDNHYGHLRLDLIRSFGFEEGERIHSAFAEWGIRLPYICISDQLMLSHSLGKLDSSPLQLFDLLHAKEQDAPHMRQLGYETWHARRPTLHSALINNRNISATLLNEFSSVFGVHHFVVGHCHYRSGDTLRLGENTITTVVSSAPNSPDSGHYMYQQMMVTRAKMGVEENLDDGDAVACYLEYAPSESAQSSRGGLEIPNRPFRLHQLS